MVAGIGDSAECHVHLCFLFQTVGVKGGQSDPLATFRLLAANNFPLGAQYDSIPSTRSADDHHGVGI
jgi:hypothetical protein